MISNKHLCLFIILLICSCAKDKSALNPRHCDIQENIFKPYLLYIGFENTCIKVYDTELHSFIDSLGGFDENVWSMVASKSGRKLYVCTRNGPVNAPGKVYAVEIQTKTSKIILTKSAEIFISPSGAPFIIASQPYHNLRQVGIIDTLSDAITWIDTLDILDKGHSDQGLVFDRNEPIFYSLTNQNNLFKYDYESNKILYTYESVGFPYHRMVIDHDGKFIYFAGGPAVDVEKDSVVGFFGYSVADYNGSLALSTDGEFLCATDPAKYLLPEPIASGKVAVFHSLPKGISGDVSYIDVISSTISLPGGHGWQTDRIVVTKDGKRAYVSNWIDLIYVLDLENQIVSDVIELNWYFPRTLSLVPK